MASRIAVLIPYYNGSKYIKRCVASLSCDMEDVWIVDNSEIPEPVPLNCKHIVTDGKRLGFAKAVNIGLRKVTEAGYDSVIILNQDAYFRENHFETFINTIEDYPSHFVCPLLFTEEFKQVIPFVKERYFKMGIPSIKKEIKDYIGVVVAGRLELFNSLNGFDENFFMYFEENDLFRRAENPYPIVLDPFVNVAHRDKEQVMGKEELEWFFASELYFAKKHEGKLRQLLLQAKLFLRKWRK